jgi:hypothetical protein
LFVIPEGNLLLSCQRLFVIPEGNLLLSCLEPGILSLIAHPSPPTVGNQQLTTNNCPQNLIRNVTVILRIPPAPVAVPNSG